MKFRKYFLIFYYALIIPLINLYAQQSEPHYLNENIEMKKWLTENNVPAVGIGIIMDGKLKQIKMFGELKKNNPAPYNTIFNVASLTKPVVAMLTLKLVSMGEWKLEEPLSNYYIDPDVANDPRSKKLNTRHILSHQTGFVNWRWLHKSKKLTFDFDPGTKFQYSGEGFEYLKHALEGKFKKPLEQLADSLIFKPLKMADSRFVWNKSMDSSRFAMWHDKDGRNTYETTKQTVASAADDLLTTIEDYGNFCVAVINGFGLPEIIFNDMVKPQAIIKKNDYMGLGWEILDSIGDNEYALVHTGSDKGVKTLAILLPKSKEGLLIMTNGDNGTSLYNKLIIETLSLGKEIMERAK